MTELIPIEKWKESKKANTISEGDIVEGTIVKITNYGAFVKIKKDTTGLLHISEISWNRIPSVESELSVGENIKVKVIYIEDNKIGLSLKKLSDKPKKFKEKSKGDVYNIPKDDLILDRLSPKMIKKLKKLTGGNKK